METSALPAAGLNIASPRAERGRFARSLLGLEVGLCVGAAGGAWHLIAEPHTAMPAAYLSRTPFSSWIAPGALLALCVALPAGVVAFGTTTRRTYAHAGHPALGLTLMGWIVVQLIVLGPASLLQPAMFAWGLVILLLGAANYRRWHSGWGATAAERSAELAGDELMIKAHFVANRAIAIGAPPQAVWPWIVQIGYGRAGWYSYDLLDNRGRHGAERIDPRWQRLRVGDPVPMSPASMTTRRSECSRSSRTAPWCGPSPTRRGAGSSRRPEPAPHARSLVSRPVTAAPPLSLGCRSWRSVTFR